MLTLLAATALATSEPPPFVRVEERDGITLESRPVPGSAYVELRLTTTSSHTPGSLCEAAFGTGRFDPQEPDLKSRTVLLESADERVTYDQISPPLVANRDYAVRAQRELGPDGSCAVRFSLANELAPPRPEGWVRLTQVAGSWSFVPQPDGRTRVTYVIHTDPAGSLPPFLVEGSRRTLAVKWVRLILSRGRDAADAGR
jgi:START domain